MVLSILIPVFNWDVTLLLSQLVKELQLHGNRVDLLIADDCSTDFDLKSLNELFVHQLDDSSVKYFSLEKNLGRAAVRNFLSKKTDADFLLFLDADVLPDHPDFIGQYLQHISTDVHDVVCGGISYKTRLMKGREYDYRIYFGNRKEVAPASTRNRDPGKYLLTANVLLKKEVFMSTPFDEEFLGYGYEDTDWGIRLAQKKNILHIDNTVSHLGLDTVMTCYNKMRESVLNYLRIRDKYPDVFAAAPVGKLARCIQSLPGPVLSHTERFGRWLLKYECLYGFWAFVLMQTCFSLLLAQKLRECKQVNR